MRDRARFLSILCLVFSFSVVGGGCRSAREQAREARRPRSIMLEAQHVLGEDPLEQTERATLMLWEKTHAQSHHLLQVAPDGLLKKRSHKHHDLSLTCLKGSAIIKVGEHRYFVQPRDTVVIPRMYTYEIRPHGAEGAFAAMAVFSPPFEGKDWVWPQEDKADKR